VFVERVDMVSGVGRRRATESGSEAVRFHDVRWVVTNLGVLDFEARSQAMRLRSVHPGVTVGQVVEATGFELIVADDVGDTRLPTDEELRLIREVLDPSGMRDGEVKG
jgi:acyl CoA:acetate/3-ketoacid CoA transferase beta subunit